MDEGIAGLVAADGYVVDERQFQINGGTFFDPALQFLGFGDTTLFVKTRATERSRTADLMITNQLLYQLSYGG